MASMIEKFFGGDLRVEIMKYCKKLESIVEKYDVLIFMARKSICFFDALVINGEIKLLDREVVITTSSRVLFYDCEFLKGKKIALIDDIVIRGKTLNDTIRFLTEQQIVNFDVYYIASQNSKNGNIDLISKYLCDPIIELDSKQLLILGNAITNYINASACSYNVDYPVFYMDEENDFFIDYIEKTECTVIPNSIENSDGNIYVQNFDCKKYFMNFKLKELKYLNAKYEEIIIKLRIFYRPNSKFRKVVVIPIIVLPELSEESIDVIFNELSSFNLKRMVINSDKQKQTINKLNVIQYILAYQLFMSVNNCYKKFQFKYSLFNQEYIFPITYKEELIKCLKECSIISSDNIEFINAENDYFVLCEIYRALFDYLGNMHKKDPEHKEKFTFSEVMEYCQKFQIVSKDKLQAYMSTLFDYAIDCGLIVPEMYVNNGRYIRAYRLSEQYDLQEEHFELILYMFNGYMSKTKKTEMSKIQTEKLLVLFFREVIRNIVDEYKVKEGEERSRNLFGITYARFGPVVSDNSTELGVTQDTYLTNRLFDEVRGPYKRLELNNNGRVYMKQSADKAFDLPNKWKASTQLFINNYDYVEKILDYYDVYNEMQNIKTFDKFLILAAIGDNKENQLLSIAAELRIFQNALANYNNKELIVYTIDYVVDGLQNGLWKYLCYKNNEHHNCYAAITRNIQSKGEELKHISREITRNRERIIDLKKVYELSLKDMDKSILEAIKISCDIKSDNYLIFERRFAESANNFEKKKELLNTFLEVLRVELLEKNDILNQKKDEIDSKFLDSDKLLSIFYNQSRNINISEEFQNHVNFLMDESVILIYEILYYWNIILEKIKKGELTVEKNIKNTNKNLNYLSKVQQLVSSCNTYRQRIIDIKSSKLDIDDIFSRMEAITFEIDLLLIQINEYVLKNVCKYDYIKEFYVIRRDDENDIEIDEILKAKSKETALNEYLEILNNKCCAALKKTIHSAKLIKQLSDYDGYTLIDYHCKRKFNIILQIDKKCYSKRIKGVIKELLDNNDGKIIEVTDRW